MKIINDIGDEAIYNAIVYRNSYKPSHDRMRANELVDSPQIKHLRIKHWDEIQVPASSFLFSLSGTLMHELLQKHAPSNSLTEEHLKTQVRGVTISGTPDNYQEAKISDYKNTSLWAFTFGKEEWESVQNVYAYLFRVHGFEVNSLQIKAILRDWTASEAFRKPDYPQTPFRIIDIPLWSKEEQLEFIEHRIGVHKAQEATRYFVCTPKEQWQRPTTWAVMKKSGKRAKAVFGTDLRPGGSDEAFEYIKKEIPAKDHKLFEVIKRTGAALRCEAYCQVAQFCPQYQREKAEREAVSDEAEG